MTSAILYLLIIQSPVTTKSLHFTLISFSQSAVWSRLLWVARARIWIWQPERERERASTSRVIALFWPWNCVQLDWARRVLVWVATVVSVLFSAVTPLLYFHRLQLQFDRTNTTNTLLFLTSAENTTTVTNNNTNILSNTKHQPYMVVSYWVAFCSCRELEFPFLES